MNDVGRIAVGHQYRQTLLGHSFVGVGRRNAGNKTASSALE